MNLACWLIAEAARGRKRVPDDIWDRLSTLEGVEIDRQSFVIEGFDVIFRATLTDAEGIPKVVWARVGTLDSPSQTKSLEEKLLQADQAISREEPELAGTGGGQGGSGTTRGRPRAEEHPERSRKGGKEVSRISPRALAVFGNTREDVSSIRLSS